MGCTIVRTNGLEKPTKKENLTTRFHQVIQNRSYVRHIRNFNLIKLSFCVSSRTLCLNCRGILSSINNNNAILDGQKVEISIKDRRQHPESDQCLLNAQPNLLILESTRQIQR